MAKQRQKISNQTKRSLQIEAGNKCANPGCAARRVHLHHIKQWAVYETNDAKHMVAVCPTCHDAIHHGDLALEDETLYLWKGITRDSVTRAHLYVEPGPEPMILLGSVGVFAKSGAEFFQMSATSRLGFRIIDPEILNLNLDINDHDGVPLVRVVEGHVRFVSRDMIDLKSVPGWIRITTPESSGIVPDWVLQIMKADEADFGPGGTI